MREMPILVPRKQMRCHKASYYGRVTRIFYFYFLREYRTSGTQAKLDQSIFTHSINLKKHSKTHISTEKF